MRECDVVAWACLVLVAIYFSCFFVVGSARLLTKEENLDRLRTCGLKENGSDSPLRQRWRGKWRNSGSDKRPEHGQRQEINKKRGQGSWTNRWSGVRAVSDGRIPWALKLLTLSGQVCSGVLISKRHFITSAKCVEYVDNATLGYNELPPVDLNQSYKAIAGAACVAGSVMNLMDKFALNRTVVPCENTSGQKATTLEVKALFVPHSSGFASEENISEVFKSDIAVFEVEGAEKSEHIRPACMPLSPMLDIAKVRWHPTLYNLQAFGYSFLESNANEEKIYTELRSVKIKNMTMSGANEIHYKRSSRPVYTGFIETIRPTNGTRSIAKGEVGGGLTVRIDGRDILLGILSAGSFDVVDNASIDFVEAYTRLECHVHLICRHTGVCPYWLTPDKARPEEEVVHAVHHVGKFKPAPTKPSSTTPSRAWTLRGSKVGVLAPLLSLLARRR